MPAARSQRACVPSPPLGGPPSAPVTPGSREVGYLVLADRAAPYLLARVRWPDVAQAITAGSPDWLDDPGLFDLPYEPSAVAVSFTQAASVAAGWGRQLHAEPAQGVPSFIRRMPANWSDLSPVERRAYGLESVGRRRVSARRLRRLRSSREKIGVRVPVANGHAGALAGDRNSAGVHRRAANGHSQVAGVTSAPGGLPSADARCGCQSTAARTSGMDTPPYPPASSI